jgi:succinate dehydrogenase / fumarate reductase cytochrome b subunit
MKWLLNFFTSSIGQKVIMSLTGLFLVLFLIVHLIGNLQLLYDDGGMAFNGYAYFMTHNPVIKLTSYGLYFFILLHAVQGILIWLKNKKSRAVGYKKNSTEGNSFASRNMAYLGLLILVFLGIHMGDFWFKMKRGQLEMITHPDFDFKIANLYGAVEASFAEWWIVLIYVISMIGLAYHLNHGFQSAFQSLGIRHPKYTPIIEFIGKVFSVLVPVLFAVIPIYYFFLK